MLRREKHLKGPDGHSGWEAPLAAPAAGAGEWTEGGRRKRKKGCKDNLPNSNQGTGFIHFWTRPPKRGILIDLDWKIRGAVDLPKEKERRGKGQGARLSRVPRLATQGKGEPEEDSAVLSSRRQTDLERIQEATLWLLSGVALPLAKYGLIGIRLSVLSCAAPPFLRGKRPEMSSSP